MQSHRGVKQNLQLLMCFLALSFASVAVPAYAQDPTGESSSSQPPPSAQPADSPREKPPAKKNKNSKDAKDTATKSATDQPAWDPLRAEKDLEVGTYYMRKGDVDAAIDRFEDAAVAKPGFAIPYKYLGEAHEKKHQKRQAIKAYTRYLDLYPHAEDAGKIRKKIDKLWSEVNREEKSSS